MPIDFYYLGGSAPCRSVLLTAKALDVDMNLIIVDLMKGEHMNPEFLKINPLHTVPTINDNGFCLWESRAIMTYLANQYGKDDSLYPKDPKKRAIVDQRLYFDMGTLYNSFMAYYYPVFFFNGQYDPAMLARIDTAFQSFDTLLEGTKFAAGDNITLADFALVSSVSTFDVMNYDISKYKNVVNWYSRVKATAPGYKELNEDNVLLFKQFVDGLNK